MRSWPIGPALLLGLLLLLGAGGTAAVLLLRDEGGEGASPQGALGLAPGAGEEAEAPSLVGREPGPPEAAATDPHAPLRATGRVVDPDGRPIAGASVYALPTGLRPVERYLRARLVATTDEGGRFTVRGERFVGLVARADGFLDRAVHLVPRGVPVRIVLQPATAHVMVRVLGAGGSPLSGAFVRAFAAYDDTESTGPTDAAGTVRLPFRGGAATYVAATARGHLLFRRARVPPVDAAAESRMTIQLEASFRIRGRVVDDESGEGIAGAEIHSWEVLGAIPRTGADGRFDYEASYAVPWIRAEARGYAMRQVPLQRDEAGNGHAEIHLTPRPEASVKGRVLAPDGTPVGHASLACGHLVAESDSEGAFEIDLTAAGAETLVVYAHHPAYGLASAEARRRKEATLRFPDTAIVSGQVRYDDGTPAADVDLRLDAPHLAVVLLGLHLSASIARTEEDGRFRLPPLPPGPYRLVAAPRHALAGRGVGASFVSGRDPAEIELVLPRGRAMEGVVVDGAGRPVAEAVVTAADDDPVSPGQRYEVHATSDAKGRFRLTGLVERRLGFSARAAGYRPWSRTMTPGDEPLRVQLEKLPIVVIRITENPPPPGTEMVATFLGHDGTGRGGGSAFYVNGEVRLERWHEGVAKVRLTWRDLAGGPVDVPEGDDVLVAIALRRLSGDAAPPAGALPPQPGPVPTASEPSPRGWVQVQVAPVPEGGLRHARVLADGMNVGGITSDGRGRVLLEAGRHVLTVGLPETTGAEATVTVVAGEQVDVELTPPPTTGTIRGRVVDSRNQPVGGIAVAALPMKPRVSMHQMQEAETDAQGRFFFHYLQGTRYRLRPPYSGDRLGSFEPEETEPDGAEVRLTYVRHGLLRAYVAGDWPERPSRFAVGIDRWDEDGFVTWSSSVSLQPDGDGFYFERRLAPGRYHLVPPTNATWRWLRDPGEILVEEGGRPPPIRVEIVGYER